MRRVLVFVITAAVGLSLWGCDTTSEPCECSSENAITLVWASYEDDFAAPASRDGWAWLYGVLTADPLPTLQSVHLNDEEFSDPYFWFYESGYAGLGEVGVTSGPGPIEVVVSTSAGDVSGSEDLPDEITHLEFSEPETLDVGQPLTVSWPGQEADFYYFALEYLRDDWAYAYVETLVSGQSVTIAGSFFSHDGIIWDVWVQPNNGPLPSPGARGNMSGYGSGFLYYSRDGYWTDPEIQVGDGIQRRMPSLTPRSTDTRRANAQATIRQMLDLPAELDG